MFWMDLRAIASGRDHQPQKHRLKPLFFRQISKVFGLLNVTINSSLLSMSETMQTSLEISTLVVVFRAP